MYDLHPGVRQISSPVSDEQLSPLAPQCHTVQFSEALKKTEYPRVASFLRSYPEVKLRVYGHSQSEFEWETLSFFEGVRKLTIEVSSLDDFSGLACVGKEVEELGLGETRSKRPSLRILEAFPRLRSLWIVGHTKGWESIASLENLETLSLRSIKEPSFSELLSLERLHSLEIKLGNSSDLAGLAALNSLRYLELWQIRGLQTLEFLSSLTGLQYLFLQSLANVSVLPDLSRLKALRRVHIENLRRLHELHPLSAARALEQLVLVSMTHLRARDIAFLSNHESLREATIALKSRREDDIALRALGNLPKASPGTEFVFR